MAQTEAIGWVQKILGEVLMACVMLVRLGDRNDPFWPTDLWIQSPCYKSQFLLATQQLLVLGHIYTYRAAATQLYWHSCAAAAHLVKMLYSDGKKVSRGHGKKKKKKPNHLHERQKLCWREISTRVHRAIYVIISSPCDIIHTPKRHKFFQHRL